MTAVKNLVLPAEPLINIDAAVEVLQDVAPSENWGRRKVYLLAQRGQIPSARIGWSVKFRASDLRRWFADGGTSPDVVRERLASLRRPRGKRRS